jgi:hypothetical protein
MALSKQYLIIIGVIIILAAVVGISFYMGFKKVASNVAPPNGVPIVAPPVVAPTIVVDCETIQDMNLECAVKIARQEIPTCNVPIQQSFLDAFLVFQNDIMKAVVGTGVLTLADKKIIYFQQLSVTDQFRIYLAISINSLIALARCTAPKNESLGARIVQLTDEFFGIV